jgi:predicted lipoprotein
MGIVFKRQSLKIAFGSWLLMGFLALGGCRPWTIVPVDGGSDTATSSQNPAAFVDSVWSAKLVPAIVSSAIDARTLLDAMSASIGDAERKYGRNANGDGWYFNVKGEGTVLAVDTSSRNGLIDLRVVSQSRRPDVSIQIGPVFRGSALRDSTGIITFGSFVNQLQFADVADDLNNKARQTVLSSLDAKTLIGKRVKFVGSFEAESAAQPLIHNVVPVQLAVETPQ